MSQASEMLERARAAYRAGEIGEAKRLYQYVLDNFPDSAEADDARLELDAIIVPGRPFGTTTNTDSTSEIQLVRVVDLDIKFWSMVWLMIKWAIAAIPAAIILMVVVLFALAMLGGAVGQF